MFADVIVDINNDEVDKIFEYSFDDCGVFVGSRVLVPFGKKNIEGIIIQIKNQSNYPPEKVKPIIKVLEQTPALTSETIALMQHVCKTCYVTRASALRLFLPSEMRKGKVKEQFVRIVGLVEGLTLNKLKVSCVKAQLNKNNCLIFCLKIKNVNFQF